MICYRDRSFCTAYGETCFNHQCDRALTDEETRRAARWWSSFGSDDPAPIAMMDMSRGCADLVAEEAS